MAAKATAIFEADDSKLTAAFKRIGESLLEVEAGFAVVATAGAAIFAVVGAGALALGAGIKEALDIGGHFLDLTNNTGIAIDDLAALELEFKNAGKAAEDVPAAIGKMQKALVEGTANDTIEKLGLSIEDLKAKGAADQFHILGDAIDKVDNASERTAASMAIFGKSGASLLAVFASHGFGDAAEQVGKQAQILAKDAALFDDIGDKLNLVGLKVQGFFVGVTDRVAPTLKPLLDAFAKFDAAELGQRVGDIIADTVEIFQSGQFGSLVTNALNLAFTESVNYFVYAMTEGLARFSKVAVKALVSNDGSLLKGFNGGKTETTDSLLKGNLLDPEPFRKALAEQFAKVSEAAAAKREAAYAAVPTEPGKNGNLSELSDTKDIAANVSALTRVGGGLGGGGDPLLAENQRQTGILQEIRDSLDERLGLNLPGSDPASVYK